MEKKYMVCTNCFRSLNQVGIAQEVYSLIASEYIEENKALQITHTWKTIVKFLEKKGFVVTHEVGNRLYARPYIDSTDEEVIFCRRGHKNKSSNM